MRVKDRGKRESNPFEIASLSGGERCPLRKKDSQPALSSGPGNLKCQQNAASTPSLVNLDIDCLSGSAFSKDLWEVPIPSPILQTVIAYVVVGN